MSALLEQLSGLLYLLLFLGTAVGSYFLVLALLPREARDEAPEEAPPPLHWPEEQENTHE